MKALLAGEALAAVGAKAEAGLFVLLSDANVAGSTVTFDPKYGNEIERCSDIGIIPSSMPEFALVLA